jgi:hypothetical protein
MRGFVFLGAAISVSYTPSNIPVQFLHSPRNPLFRGHRRNFIPKFAFGPRNERGIVSFSVYQIFLFNGSVASRCSEESAGISLKIAIYPGRKPIHQRKRHSFPSTGREKITLREKELQNGFDCEKTLWIYIGDSCLRPGLHTIPSGN